MHIEALLNHRPKHELTRVEEDHNLIEDDITYVINLNHVLLRLNESLTRKHCLELLTELRDDDLVTVELLVFDEEGYVAELLFVQHADQSFEKSIVAAIALFDYLLHRELWTGISI